MKRWSYTLLTIAMLVAAVLLRHAPAAGADPAALPEAPQGAAEEGPKTFVPTEKLPADATISFPVDI